MEENIDNPIEEQQSAELLEEAKVDQAAEPHKDNSADVNMAKLRNAKEKAEKERAIMAAQLEDIKKQHAAKEEVDYEDEDFVEGKHLKKEIESVKNQLKSYQQQQSENSDEARLKSAYSDFDSVVNSETIEKLKELDPETAETIATSSASLFTRGAAAYKRIKELNLANDGRHDQNIAKTNANVAKPRPMNSVSPQQGESPLSMANAFSNGLTPDLKMQLWKEMQEAAKKH